MMLMRRISLNLYVTSLCLDFALTLCQIFAPRHHTMRPEWESIRCHPFFASIDRKKLENRRYDRKSKSNVCESAVAHIPPAMFKACLGNAPLQPVDSGKLAIKRSHPQLPAFKKVVREQKNLALGRVHVDYKFPAQATHDALHGATCKAPGTEVLPEHVCNCDLPANWHKL